MIFHPHLKNEGLGFLAIFGFVIVIVLDPGLRHLTEDPASTDGPDWAGGVAWTTAALYCWLVHAIIVWNEKRQGYEDPGAFHTLGRVPIRYWSIFYLFMAMVGTVGAWILAAIANQAHMPSAR